LNWNQKSNCKLFFRKNPTLLNQLRVTIGEYDLSLDEVPVESIDFGIEKLTVHPKFDIRRYSYELQYYDWIKTSNGEFMLGQLVLSMKNSSNSVTKIATVAGSISKHKLNVC